MAHKFRKNLPLLLFIFIGLIYLVTGYGVTISNDSVTNIDQIVALDLLSRSSHFTFHLFAILSYSLFALLLGLPAVPSVEIMLSLWSLLGSVGLYFIVKTYNGNQRLAIFAMLFYAFSTGIFRFSVQAEYLVLVPSLALISLALYGKRCFFASGVVWALGLLASPFVLFFAPAFFLWLDIKQLFKKQNYIMLTGFFTIYLTVSYFTFSESIKGEWSYKVVFDYYAVTLANLNYLRIAAIWAYGYLRSFLVVVPFIFAGLYHCYRHDRKLFWIVVLVIIAHIPAAIPEARYGGYQLTAYPFVALLAAIGTTELFTKSRYAGLVILLAFAFFNCFIVYSERQFNRDLRDTYLALQNSPEVPVGAVLFTYQASKPIEKVYAPKLKAVGMLTDYQEKNAENLPGYKKTSIEQLIRENDALYLLESGMSMPDDHIKLLFKRFVKGQGAKVKGFGKERLACCVDTSAMILMPQFAIETYQIKK